MDRVNQIVLARHAIEEIMFRYAEGIDTGDIESMGELFAEGAIILPDGSRISGYEEVFDAYAGMIMFYDENENIVPYKRNECSPRTRHMVTNLIFEFDDAVAVADVRSYFSVYQTLGGENQLIAGGRYVDRFEGNIQGWHLVTRTIHFENMGDMSRHNTAFESD